MKLIFWRKFLIWWIAATPCPVHRFHSFDKFSKNDSLEKPVRFWFRLHFLSRISTTFPRSLYDESCNAIADKNWDKKMWSISTWYHLVLQIVGFEWWREWGGDEAFERERDRVPTSSCAKSPTLHLIAQINVAFENSLLSSKIFLPTNTFCGK